MKEVYTAVVSIKTDTFEADFANIINAVIKQYGGTSSTKIHYDDIATPLNNIAETIIKERALASLEQEILESKMCVNGTCED